MGNIKRRLANEHKHLISRRTDQHSASNECHTDPATESNNEVIPCDHEVPR
jgi:hypothetical protein